MLYDDGRIHGVPHFIGAQPDKRIVSLVIGAVRADQLQLQRQPLSLPLKPSSNERTHTFVWSFVGSVPEPKLLEEQLQRVLGVARSPARRAVLAELAEGNARASLRLGHAVKFLSAGVW